jgi:hypothetical protein
VRCVIFVIDAQSRSADGDEIAAIDAFNDQLRTAGEFVMAFGLAAPPHAMVIDNRSDAGIEHSGSIFHSDEFFSGMWIIEVDSPEVARTRAMQASRACNRRVELRPFL